MKKTVFYLLLCLPLCGWAIVMIAHYLLGADDGLSLVVEGFVNTSPFVRGDLTLFGEITPAILAGAIIAAVPPSGEIKAISIVLAAATYVAFIHFSLFFSSGPGVALIASSFSDVSAPRDAILALISNVRIMAMVIFGTLLGFKFK